MFSGKYFMHTSFFFRFPSTVLIWVLTLCERTLAFSWKKNENRLTQNLYFMREIKTKGNENGFSEYFRKEKSRNARSEENEN